jgi:hypothetical protein
MLGRIGTNPTIALLTLSVICMIVRRRRRAARARAAVLD